MSNTPINQEENAHQIPPPYSGTFEHGIAHPSLYLWDAWSFMEADTLHLYCLAVARLKADGTTLLPSERNGTPFHIRHFTSENFGKSWKDEGCFLKIEAWSKKLNCYTIWSGSIEAMPDGRKLVAFTGLEKRDAKHSFVQNIVLANSDDGFVVDEVAENAISSPLRDWETITKEGYYLAAPAELGNDDGEGGGPILAWRDPFIFLSKDEKVNLFWGGKVSPKESALVRAELKKEGAFYIINKLFSPVTMPDGKKFTQLELPKVFHDNENQLYYLLISSCNRIYEGQSDEEVDKGVRIYKSDSLDGPWHSLGSKILGSEKLFGPTVLKTDFKNNRLLCIAPYTDAAEDNLSLTFSPVFYVYLDTLRVEFL